MELRHLRYFVAVAQARSLKLAAEETLRTTQPSLSRQIRDLEHELGTALFSRSARGVELTAAGRVFLEHARTVLAQAETAVASVRGLGNSPRPAFALGFMIGHESTWAPAALTALREDLPNLHLVISTQNSPQLASAVEAGLLDVAFLRSEDCGPGVEIQVLVDEPIEVFLPANHALAAQESILLEDAKDEVFLSISEEP